MKVDQTALSRALFETIKNDLENRQRATRLQREGLEAEARGFAYAALVERDVGAQERLAGLIRTVEQLRRDQIVQEYALEEATARAARYTPAHSALAQLEKHFFALWSEIDAALGRFRNHREVPTEEITRYADCSHDAMVLWNDLLRITGDRARYRPFDELSAADRLRYSGSSRAQRLVERLPAIQSRRRSWIDLLEVIEGKQDSTELVPTGGKKRD